MYCTVQSKAGPGPVGTEHPGGVEAATPQPLIASPHPSDIHLPSLLPLCFIIITMLMTDVVIRGA